MIRRCDLAPQYEALQAEIDAAIRGVLRSGRYTLGDNVAAFEREFAAYVGCEHGVGVNSGTDALMIVLWHLALEPGDEVVTTPFTAIPTYAAIRHVGATPVFVDVDPSTFLLDLDQLEGVLSPRTRAVVPVHLFGNVVDIDRLRAIVGPEVFILEDCAQAHGATLGGRRVGSLGDAAAFSFYPTKNLGAYGDAGMVVTDDPALAESVRLKRMYGMVDKDTFVVDGINSRLDEVQAAILRVKLRHLDRMNDRRRSLAELYDSLLDADYATAQETTPNAESAHHVYAVVTRDRRDELMEHLEAQGIQSNVYYPMPIPAQEPVRAALGESPALPVVERLTESIIALPFYPELAEETVAQVVTCVNQFATRKPGAGTAPPSPRDDA